MSPPCQPFSRQGWNYSDMLAFCLNCCIFKVHSKVPMMHVCLIAFEKIPKYLCKFFLKGLKVSCFCWKFYRKWNIPRSIFDLFYLFIIYLLLECLRYILLENVKGFECSHTCQSFLDVLKERGYRFQQFLLNSDQFGIPNSRLRYYLIAKKTVEGSDSNMDDEGFTPTENILTSLPKEWWDDLHEKPSDFKKKEAKENSKTLLGHILSAPPHSLQPEIACVSIYIFIYSIITVNLMYNVLLLLYPHCKNSVHIQKNGRAMHAQIKQLAHFLDDGWLIVIGLVVCSLNNGCRDKSDTRWLAQWENSLQIL